MRNAAFAIALSLSGASVFAAFVDELPEYRDKTEMCRATGTVFESSAGYRDLGKTPQQSLKAARIYIKGGKFPITEAQAKKAINLVYFDRSLSLAGGPALGLEVFDACMNDWKTKFQPLK